MLPVDPTAPVVLRPRFRLVDPSGASVAARDPQGPVERVESFVELARLVLGVSSLSAQRSALVRGDLRSLLRETRRDEVRAAVCQALMASVVEVLADGVSTFSLRALQSRARLAPTPEPA